MNTFSPHTQAKSAEVNQNFTDLSTGVGDVDNNSLALFRAELLPNFIHSGLIWTQVSGLNGAMTLGIGYVEDTGNKTQRLSVAAIASRAFTASKDTYVDLRYDGVLVYTEVANGATTGFALAANSTRVAKIVTSGAAITEVVQVGFDALETMIYRTNRDILSLAADGTGGATVYNHTGAMVQFAASATGFGRGYVNVPRDYVAGTKLRLVFRMFGISGASTCAFNYFINSMGFGDNNSAAWNIASNLNTASFAVSTNIYTDLIIEVNSATVQKNDVLAFAIKPNSNANSIALAAVFMDYVSDSGGLI